MSAVGSVVVVVVVVSSLSLLHAATIMAKASRRAKNESRFLMKLMSLQTYY